MEMSLNVVVPRPRCEGHPVATDPPPVHREAPQPSSGSATAGYRTAKYSTGEWFSNYLSNLQQAGTDRNQARSIQQESRTMKQDTESLALSRQAEGTRLLGERLQDIHYWKSELQRHIALLQAGTDTLVGLRTRLDRALDTTDTSYTIAMDNLNCRTRRLGSDLVRDAVEDELLKEVDLIRRVQEILKGTTVQVINQIKINRETKQTLEFDWSDKYMAHGFDERSGRHNNLSPDTRFHPSSATLQEQVCNPSTWTKFTQDNLAKAMQVELATNNLRLLVEQVLQDTTEDLRAQCCSVDRAFSQRCGDMCEAKFQLENKLSQVLELIGVQEKNIGMLQQAIHNKEAPLRVVQSRLYLRSLRPNMELCRDEPQISLENEVSQIDASLACLQQQLSEARDSLSNLEDSRVTLEKDLNGKTQSLFIDREKCMTQRRRYPTVSELSGY
ncbi:tektin-4 [Gouania willdenowi]|uniref:Tektin n=1 Tax=Gouania willdenowi TaxID=441366 RepID=A0A8C5D2Q5_GOUWI|nr:tektin-4 [Gouania willdenowi]XP_028310770.1 tektin-4 [Gouania willdenowi]